DTYKYQPTLRNVAGLDGTEKNSHRPPCAHFKYQNPLSRLLFHSTLCHPAECQAMQIRGFGTSKDTEDRTTTTIFPNSVFADGTPNNVPIALGGQTYNRNYGFTGLDDLNIEDGSWVRLREVSLSYAFPASLLSKTKAIKSASLALTARNLFLSTKYSGIDPETNLTGASNDFGEDYFNMPNTKSYGFNLTVTF
ncbi:MAG: hypothetical protein ACKO96_16750, partial [Flammeovirgaceae bacterium]